ncbi:cupredoxin family copper-binding protein [Actinoallomurus sp. NPDC052308]
MNRISLARGRPWPAALIAVGGMLLPAACGWGQDTPSSPAARSAPRANAPAGAMPGMRMHGGSGSGAAPAAAPVAANSVSIKGFAFAPASVSVKAGTTVTWTNKDEEPHTVVANGGAFHSAALTPGGVFRYRFTKPGSYPYVCSIHPFMRGTVVVTP